MECFTDRKDFRLWNIDSPCVCGVEANNVSNNKIFFFKFPTPKLFPNYVRIFCLNSYFLSRVCVSTWQSPGRPGRWRKRTQVYNVLTQTCARSAICNSEWRVLMYSGLWFDCVSHWPAFYQYFIKMIFFSFLF